MEFRSSLFKQTADSEISLLLTSPSCFLMEWCLLPIASYVSYLSYYSHDFATTYQLIGTVFVSLKQRGCHG